MVRATGGGVQLSCYGQGFSPGRNAGVTVDVPGFFLVPAAMMPGGVFPAGETLLLGCRCEVTDTIQIAVPHIEVVVVVVAK